MKTRRMLFIIITCAMLLSVPLTAKAMAVGGKYHPPAVTIVVLHASSDVTMEILMVPRTTEPIIVYPERDRRAWETCFRLYRRGVYTIKAWYGNTYDFKDAVITVRDRGETWSVPVPYEQLKEGDFDDFLTIDMKDKTISVGRPLLRDVALFAMHLGLYLLAEAIVVYFFGIRSVRSWLVFILETIVSKGIFCVFVHSWINVDRRAYIALAVGTIFFVVIDMMVYLLKMEEEKNLIAKMATVSNIVGGGVAYFMLWKLPM